MHWQYDFGDLLGLLGVAFSAASFLMKRMLPLRVLAIFANIVFIGYGLWIHAWPGLVLNLALLPVNLKRIHEIKQLSKEIARASANAPVSEWLLPHMRRRLVEAGETLFRKGEAADRLIYLAAGELDLVELGTTVGPGELVGEIGLFAPDRRRTQTAVCKSPCEVYEMTDEMLFQVYYQHPGIGFYLVRLIAARLMSDVERERVAGQSA
jgi:CRP/FNR family cyclic AMP-dependent transcriptional regulator